MPILMRMLLEATSKGETVTYGDVQRRIEQTVGGRFSSLGSEQIGHVAGSLMDRILEVYPKNPPPPINALVINKTKKLPGIGVDGYVERYFPKTRYSRLNDRKKRETIAAINEIIWDYPGWPEVARKAFNVRSGGTPPADKQGEHDGKLRRRGYGGPAESPEHKRLKLYVLSHPQQFGASPGCKAVPEKLLRSHDEVDVFCVVPSEQLAIEVKSVRSIDQDLERGVFQCVKYRAVLQAEAKWLDTDPKIRVRLVSERPLSRDCIKHAKQLGIEVQVIKPLA
jgi:hypothetical protein